MADSIHYVKFMRGSTAAWKTLQETPNRISNDTLYFIYDSPDKTTGSLYLGQKLISGASSGSSVININDIEDIVIGTEPLVDKQILVYNEASQQWENTSLTTIINTAVGEMQGASEQFHGVAGLVPQPKAGDQNKFLKGDGTWTSINIPNFDENIFKTTETENSIDISLLNFNSAAIGSIPIKTSEGLQWSTMSPGQLTRQITTLEKLQNQLSGVDSEPLDLNTIYMVTKSDDSTENDRYSEYMIINNKIELLGTFGSIDLTDYVKTVDFNLAVTSLQRFSEKVTTLENAGFITQAEIGYLDNLVLSQGNNTLVEEINSINDRLKWGSLDNT